VGEAQPGREDAYASPYIHNAGYEAPLPCGRFLAAFAVNACWYFLTIGCAAFFLPARHGPGELLPFRPWAYLSVYLFIALPNAFIATALQFSLAALSRQVMTSYLASLLLAIVAQVIAMAAAKLFGNWDHRVRLLDPVGVAGIIGSELATWTPTERIRGWLRWTECFFGIAFCGLV
jgi:hypothetical protein